ncbi:sensor histidine kinase [Flammeovirga sp. OC4]|uniref:sensor histidine kinase n=1 Tax=Flammeovirga sp. OC4 TaxID=1382345 RepID=UPI000694CAF9|nr:histidine kinase [Flammeovirga sp. OC4]
MPLRSFYFFTIAFYYLVFFVIEFFTDYRAESDHQWLGLNYLLVLALATTFLKCFGAIFFARISKYVLIKKSSILAFIILFSGFLLILFLYSEVSWVYRWSYFLEDFRGPFYNIYNLQAALIPYFIGICIEIVFEYLKQYNEQQSLKLEKTKAELSFLKAQISPHFLFNTINTIFWLIIKDPKGAQELLLKLSDMLRYQLYECDHDFVPIQKEIDYLTHLCKVQGYRKGKKVKITTEFDCEDTVFQIPPLLFLPLVENAMKYVSQKDDKENYISIFLRQRSNLVSFEIVNSTDNSHIELEEDKKYSGIGLSNIKKRLSLIYGNNYKFSTSLINNVYYAKIEF